MRVVVHAAFLKGQCLLVLCRSELHKIVPCSAHLGSWGGAQCVEKRQAGHYGGKGGAGTFSGGRHGLEHCARKARGIFLKECPKISMYCHCIEIRRVMRVCSREENQGKTTKKKRSKFTILEVFPQYISTPRLVSESVLQPRGNARKVAFSQEGGLGRGEGDNESGLSASSTCLTSPHSWLETCAVVTFLHFGHNFDQTVANVAKLQVVHQDDSGGIPWLDNIDWQHLHPVLV